MTTRPNPLNTTLIAIPIRDSGGGYQIGHAFPAMDGEPPFVCFGRLDITGARRTEYQVQTLGGRILPGLGAELRPAKGRGIFALTDAGQQMIWPSPCAECGAPATHRKGDVAGCDAH